MSGGIAVVGAGGFLGRSLCSALEAADLRVTRFTRSSPCVLPGAGPHPALASARTVYFLAGSVTPATAVRGNGSGEDLRLLEQCLDCLRRTGTAPRVVLASSGGRVYDAGRRPPYAEGSPLRPSDPYGAGKLQLERRLLDGNGAWRPVVLRIANAYGPGQRVRDEHGVVAHWLAAARRGEPIRMFGDPSAARDYVYVDDVVAALRSVHDHPDPPEVVNIGSGAPTTLGELARLVGALAGGVDVRSVSPRSFDPERTWLDVSLARERLGWTATVPLEEGLRRTWLHGGWEDDAS